MDQLPLLLECETLFPSQNDRTVGAGRDLLRSSPSWVLFFTFLSPPFFPSCTSLPSFSFANSQSYPNLILFFCHVPSRSFLKHQLLRVFPRTTPSFDTLLRPEDSTLLSLQFKSWYFSDQNPFFSAHKCLPVIVSSAIRKKLGLADLLSTLTILAFLQLGPYYYSSSSTCLPGPAPGFTANRHHFNHTTAQNPVQEAGRPTRH